MKSIRLSAFFGCTSLKEVISLNTTPPSIGEDVFDESTLQNCPLYVPEIAVTAYQTAYGWRDFVSIKAYDETDISTTTSEAGVKNAKTYTINGTAAPEGYKGVVIRNGKKILNK